MDHFRNDLFYRYLSTPILSDILHRSTLRLSTRLLDIGTAPESDDYAIEIAPGAPTPLSLLTSTHEPSPAIQLGFSRRRP